MNLSDWIEKLSSRINLTVTQPGVGVAHGTETFTSTHTYENFTIVASIVPAKKGSSLPPETKGNKLLPLVHYSPTNHITVMPALTLQTVSAFPLQLSVEECNLTGSPLIQQSWWYEEQLWWYDLRQEAEAAEPHLQYVLHFPNLQHALNSPNESDGYYKCRRDNVGPLEFSLEEAKLYIGYDSGTKQIFTGTINGILIDPTDSKPEKS
jgi:hypothetical protein